MEITKILLQFEKVKLHTETRWVAGSVPHVSTSCVEHSENASSLTCTTETNVCGSSTMSSVICKTAKRSPRREGNRRTRSLYSTHLSAIVTPERKPLEQQQIQRRVKGLLERRGSSASLTIDLTPAQECRPLSVTPTRECTAEEFLLSAGNMLNRSQLRKVICQPSILHKEFWDVPLNFPEEVEVCGSGVKNRYRSVLPNRRSRVILPGSDDPLVSYINANYVRVSNFFIKLYIGRYSDV